MSVSYRQAFVGQIRKDLRQSGRRLAQTLTPLFFFSVVIALFPLAMTPDSEALAKIAGGVVWVAALLAALLSLQTLFRGDFEDGSLELMALSGVPMWFQVIAKQMAHWLLTGLPLVILAPIAAYSLNLNGDAYITLMMALLLGTLVLSSFGAIGAALTVSVGQGGLLFPVLVLPLIVPALILGAKATEFAAQGRDPGGALSLLAALCILSVSLAPFATAASLRVSLD